jgi:hypothetical protein
MQLIAHYDTDGTIHALLRVDAPEGISVMVTPEPGLLAGELDDAELRTDDGSAEALEMLLKSHRVATPLPRLKLARRDD